MNLDMIDLASLQIGGIDTRDHPDYCDAYYESGQYLDGTPLPDDILEKLKDLDPNLFYEMLNNTIY
jgi:hypothetical protein